MIGRLFSHLKPSRLAHRSQFSIISSLFAKRNQEKASKQPPQPQDIKQDKQHQKSKQPQDLEYNFFERRKEIDTSYDFSKLREASSESFPEDLGKGGLQQVIYWSQSAKMPDQISQVVMAFNFIAESKPKQLLSLSNHQVYIDDFNSRVIGNVYLINSLKLLKNYAFYAYKYKLSSEQFWEKIQFKGVKFFSTSQEDASDLTDIVFIMGQFGVGEIIYNHAAKMIQNVDLSIDQYVKLFMTFHMLKRGEKQWINKLLGGLTSKMCQANAEQLSGVLPALKESKKLPQALNIQIQARTLKIIDSFDLGQLMSVSDYFGFDHKNQNFWKKLEQRAVVLFKGVKTDAELLIQLTHKVMLSYHFSTQFIKQYIVEPIQKSKFSLLEQLPVTTLSALSKGLYIYELEGETKHIEVQISKLVIGKMTKEISELKDAEIVKVIQDYNLTRNGSRQLYIFLEEVVKVRYLKGYNEQLDRHTVELLIEIYGNSGMCTRQMYEALQALILD